MKVWVSSSSALLCAHTYAQVNGQADEPTDDGTVCLLLTVLTTLILVAMGGEVTSDWLKKELELTESKLAINERKRQRDKNEDTRIQSLSPLQHLLQLNDKVNCLELGKQVTVWALADEPSSLEQEAQRCISLGEILYRNPVPPTNSKARRFYDTLLTREYQPLYEYTRSKLVSSLHRLLHEAGYPSEKGSLRLLKECQDYDTKKDTTFATYCFWLNRLQRVNEIVKAHIRGNEKPLPELSDVVIELCRPLVERILFHFVEQSDDRITSKRIDRLPEWVLNYIREHAFEGGPWDLIEGGISRLVDDAPLQFLDQMVKLAEYVLSERNFFRNEAVISNPLYMMQGIEQLLLFDQYTRDLLPQKQRVPVGLSQTVLAADDDLWSWFLDREREAAMSTLSDTDETERPPNRVSAQSEIFCSLIYSIQCKASLFGTPGKYLSRVAIPLCQYYLELVHTVSTDLRNLLSQRSLPSDRDLTANIEMWIELINGTQAAAVSLLNKGSSGLFGTKSSPESSVAGDHDLARVGRSFERLREALIDECSSTIVETLMMERAKLAAYLMRCSYILSSPDAVEHLGLSPDLGNVASIFSLILERCRDSPATVSSEMDQFAPTAIRLNVIDRLADKFLEVILDAHGMTPVLVLEGCLVVAEDVKTLFHDVHSQLADRLLNVSSFITMENRAMHGLRIALLGLSQTENAPGEVPLLNYAQFVSDGTLLNEAMSMVRAKGYALHLEDAISILNRRRDSF